MRAINSNCTTFWLQRSSSGAKLTIYIRTSYCRSPQLAHTRSELQKRRAELRGKHGSAEAEVSCMWCLIRCGIYTCMHLVLACAFPFGAVQTFQSRRCRPWCLKGEYAACTSACAVSGSATCVEPTLMMPFNNISSLLTALTLYMWLIQVSKTMQ